MSEYISYNEAIREANEAGREVVRVDVVTNLGPRTFEKGIDFDKAYIDFNDGPYTFGIILKKKGQLFTVIRENVPFIVDFE